MNHMIGKQSFKLATPVYIREKASIVGQKEGQGPLGNMFDMVGEDEKFGCSNWDEAESTLQKEAVALAIGKAGLEKGDIRYFIAGDLLGQSIASSFALGSYAVPVLGVYGACSTIGEGLCVASMMIGGGYADNIVCVTSSHFASAEKEFRYPMEYGGQRPLCTTRTVTGSGAFLVSKEAGVHPYAKITGVTNGVIVDYGIKDTFNMGCSMAPAAADLIKMHLCDFNRTPDDYDRIITGDLGEVGQKALFELLKKQGIDISKVHMDCGMTIFDKKQEGTYAGGSGCGCAASVLAALILEKLRSHEWKRVLFVPTGALLSKTSFNEGQSIPGIAQGVVLEDL